MTVTICSERDDYHAPFAHRLVIPRTVIVVKGMVMMMPNPPVFIVCANCGCWIERYVPKCRCRLNCHRGE